MKEEIHTNIQSEKGILKRQIRSIQTEGHQKNSSQRIMQIKGHLYYDNEYDILSHKRTMIGDGGKLEVVDNLPSNRSIDTNMQRW